MQVTTNVISVPKAVVDNYLETLMASVDPILKEDDLPSKVSARMLRSALYTVIKSVVARHLRDLEFAGLFDGVISIDFPGFKWTRASKMIYAMDMLLPSVLKTLAEELAKGERNVDEYVEFLQACYSISVDEETSEILEKAESPSARRLEEHALGIVDANHRLMLGATAYNALRILNCVKQHMQEGRDPLSTLEDDLDLFMPWPVIDL